MGLVPKSRPIYAGPIFDFSFFLFFFFFLCFLDSLFFPIFFSFDSLFFPIFFFIQVHFNEGKIVPENTLLVDFEAEWAILGTLVNGSHLLNPLKIELDWVGEYNCMQVLRIPKEISGEPLDHKVKLPSTILGLPESQRVMVKPSKMMFFNRVAKTGSQSIIHLLVTLGEKLGYKTIPQIRQRETVADNEKGIREEVNR